MSERANGRVNHRNIKLNSIGIKSSEKTRRKSTTKGSSAKNKNLPARKRKVISKLKKQSIPSKYRSVEKKNEEVITYVLDTNVIMDSWDVIFQFEEHEVCIVSQVWEELDNHKKGHSEIAWNVRKATRAIDAIVAGKTAQEISDGITLTPPPEIINGKPHTGKLLFNFSSPKIPEKLSFDLNPNHPDDRIIMVCLEMQAGGKRVVLVSNDANCRVRAVVCGLESEEYLNEAIINTLSEEDYSTGFHRMPKDFWDKVGGDLDLCLANKKAGCTYTFNHAMFKNVYCNEFLILEDGTKLRVTKKISSHKINARTFDVSAFKGTVRPRNIEQEFALELLMDPDVTAVSLAGLAGSGKTYLALAAAFHQTMEKRIYKRVVVTRSPVDSDEAIGFLPGDEEEKMSPWLGGITDNLESFVCPDSKDRNESELTGSIAFIKQKMNLQIKSLNLMKGRSFEDTLIIVDEVQDITRKTLKMISTRVGKGSKIIFLGNVAQIDNSFLTENTCGMSVLIRTFADSGLVGHVTLQQGERSSFATLAEERL